MCLIFIVIICDWLNFPLFYLPIINFSYSSCLFNTTTKSSVSINQRFRLGYKLDIILVLSWVNACSWVLSCAFVSCSEHAVVSFIILLSYCPSSHSYFAGNYTTDSNFYLIEKYSNFSVSQWKQYNPLMIIIPLVPSWDKGNLSIAPFRWSHGVLSLAMWCYIEDF